MEHGGRKIDVPEGMVYVPAGPFLMGKPNSSHHSGFIQKEVYLDAYFIDKFEVTNAEYMAFVKATDRKSPSYWNSNGGRIPQGRENHPVCSVSWDDAHAYARWCGKRLPTEAEWENAASWDPVKKRPRTYPWGEAYDHSRSNHCHRIGCTCEAGNYPAHEAWLKKWQATPEGKEACEGGGMTLPIGALAGDVSPFGCFDMAGNVQEWVADWYQEDYYKVGPSRNPRGPGAADSPASRDPRYAGQKCRVVRGGFWGGTLGQGHCSYRYYCVPPKGSLHVGVPLCGRLHIETGRETRPIRNPHSAIRNRPGRLPQRCQVSGRVPAGREVLRGAGASEPAQGEVS